MMYWKKMFLSTYILNPDINYTLFKKYCVFRSFLKVFMHFVLFILSGEENCTYNTILQENIVLYVLKQQG